MSEVKEAIILAGGMGSRMLPASLYMPKETMPLVDTPILNHLIWEASKAGIEKIHLILSERKMAIIGNHLNKQSLFSDDVRPDLPIESLTLGAPGVEIVAHVQKSPGGVADAISVAIKYIKGAFLVMLGDMVILERHLGPKHSGKDEASGASIKLVSMYEKNGLPTVGVSKVEEEELVKYGVVDLQGEDVKEIIEKPSKGEAPSDYILCGRYIMPGNTADILRKYPINEYGELQSIMLLRHFIKNGGLKATKLDNMTVYDGGDPLSWLKSQIDHALRRDDLSHDLSVWLRTKIE